MLSLSEATGIMLGIAVLAPILVMGQRREGKTEFNQNLAYIAIPFWVSTIFLLIQFLSFAGGETDTYAPFAYPVFTFGAGALALGIALSVRIVMADVKQAGLGFKVIYGTVIGLLYSSRLYLPIFDNNVRQYSLHLGLVVLGFGCFAISLSPYIKDWAPFPRTMVYLGAVGIILGSYYITPKPILP